MWAFQWASRTAAVELLADRAGQAGVEVLGLGNYGKMGLGAGAQGLDEVAVALGEEPEAAAGLVDLLGHRLEVLAGVFDAEHAGVNGLELLPEQGFGIVAGEVEVGHRGFLRGLAAAWAPGRGTNSGGGRGFRWGRRGAGVARGRKRPSGRHGFARNRRSFCVVLP
jgi:hypothetical protein